MQVITIMINNAAPVSIISPGLRSGTWLVFNGITQITKTIFGLFIALCWG